MKSKQHRVRATQCLLVVFLVGVLARDGAKADLDYGHSVATTAESVADDQEDGLGPLYLASMINHLHTERTKIMGPTPVPDHHPLPVTSVNHPQSEENSLDGVDPATDDDFYYYYFPLKNESDSSEMMAESDHMLQKPVEPLFVAMASFIGISTLFAFSVLFLPKFGSHKRSKIDRYEASLSKTITQVVDELPMQRLGELELDSLQDKDTEGTCNARWICELGRTLRKLKLHRGPLRALERILPSNMGKYVERVRSAAQRRDKCSTIRC